MWQIMSERTEYIKKPKEELVQSLESHCLLELFLTDGSYSKQLRFFFLLANNNLLHL